MLMRCRQRTSQLILAVVMIVAGIILGSVLRALHPAWGIWEHPLFLQGIGLAVSPEHGKLIYYVLTPVCCLAVQAILGLSAVGIAGVPVLLILRGSAVGAVLELLYTTDGIRGIVTALLFIMPYVCVATLLMALGAREAFGFSLQITGLVCEKAQEQKISVKLYSIRFVVLFALLAGSGILQCLWIGYVYPVFFNVLQNLF